MAKSEARKRGAFEAWLVDSGSMVTEGSSSNAWIVTDKNVLVTRHLSNVILAGVTRAGVFAALKSEEGVEVQERAFSLDEAFSAREAFMTSASGGVIPIISIDGHVLADGKPGPVTRRVHTLYSRLATGS
jgi:D-alanine transaminase